MSRVSRTYFPSGFLATLAERTSNNNVRSQDTNIIIGKHTATSMTSSALNNIIIGNDSALSLTSGDGNIYIGDEVGHTSNESNMLRIGNRGIQTSDLIEGVMSSTLGNQKVTLNGFAIITNTEEATSATDATASFHTDGGIAITKNAYIGSTLDVTSTATFTGAVVANGDVTLGNASSDTITSNGIFAAATGILLGAAGSHAGAIYNAAQNTDSTNTGSLAVNNFQTNISTATTETRTLPNGAIKGQLKRLAMSVDGGNCTVTITSATGNDTIVFTEIGQYVDLMWDGDSWTIIGSGAGDTTVQTFPSTSGGEI